MKKISSNDCESEIRQLKREVAKYRDESQKLEFKNKALKNENIKLEKKLKAIQATKTWIKSKRSRLFLASR